MVKVIIINYFDQNNLKGENCEKISIYCALFCCFILVACSAPSAELNSKNKDNDSQENNSLIQLENSTRSEEDKVLEDKEGGEDALVFCSYVFSNSNDFLKFYESFKKNNNTRYLFPINTGNNLKIKYVFTSEGVNVNDYHNLNYNIEYPFANLKIEFIVEDKSIVFINKNFFATFDSIDVSKINNLVNIDVSYSLERQKMIVCLDNEELLEFEFSLLNYQKDEIQTILEEIKDSLMKGVEYANNELFVEQVDVLDKEQFETWFDEGKTNLPNLQQCQEIKVGMSIDEVVKRIGKPQRAVGYGADRYEFDIDDGTKLVVFFLDTEKENEYLQSHPEVSVYGTHFLYAGVIEFVDSN